MTATSTLGALSLMGAALATAMVAGMLVCFAHSVMPGLGTLDDRGFLTAFRRIDAAISNPWMMLTFLGSPVLTVTALLLHLPGRSQAVLLLVVALVLIVATVLITGTIHLPLNAAIQDAAPELRHAADLRSRFRRTLGALERRARRDLNRRARRPLLGPVRRRPCACLTPTNPITHQQKEAS